MCRAEASETIGTLRELKRKSAVAFDGDGEDEAIDRQFLEADRKLLEKLRADEIPAHTRSTVLNAPNTVRSIHILRQNAGYLRPLLLSFRAGLFDCVEAIHREGAEAYAGPRFKGRPGSCPGTPACPSCTPHCSRGLHQGPSCALLRLRSCQQRRPSF